MLDTELLKSFAPTLRKKAEDMGLEPVCILALQHGQSVVEGQTLSFYTYCRKGETFAHFEAWYRFGRLEVRKLREWKTFKDMQQEEENLLTLARIGNVPRLMIGDRDLYDDSLRLYSIDAANLVDEKGWQVSCVLAHKEEQGATCHVFAKTKSGYAIIVVAKQKIDEDASEFFDTKEEINAEYLALTENPNLIRYSANELKKGA